VEAGNLKEGAIVAVIAPANTRPESDSYMKLVRRFPLKPLKNDRNHAEAVRLIEEMRGHPLELGSSDYMDTLILLINKYEDEHHTPGGASMTPQQLLKAIISANGMTQSQIGQIIGSESAVSMFLKGERGLSKNHIKALVSRFHIDAAMFL
jgi:HTH-type transcriptional regulator/antitoxin HigA